ncbi:hypothetical protein PF005_g150 [Phytophthora fragariae]|uniref:RxLR effector protein n=2 Tax=Phytophthora TaxID=4783 RepID=A0A6A3ZPA5_9STRA|nr:hypothetical protein PF003_g20165 [Phytophthora fragariae]KAE9038755.1 hypothetical protein PR002_g5852 [Phytophthora rubi]KAE8950328.1 hypothetical protein PF009_g149 [Phytophthora fragariae]KAE9021176.1 hypothetical protein PF011_g5058 [Phytophthora fragariae]KAE9044402.1 hypothetical protein PR001_g5377 [Phytophthora rubi]
MRRWFAALVCWTMASELPRLPSCTCPLELRRVEFRALRAPTASGLVEEESNSRYLSESAWLRMVFR